MSEKHIEPVLQVHTIDATNSSTRPPLDVTT